MPTMFMVDRSDLTVEEITVKRINKNTVKFHGGATHPKDGWHTSFHETFSKAKDALGKIMLSRINSARGALEEAEEDMQKFIGLQRNHILKR